MNWVRWDTFSKLSTGSIDRVTDKVVLQKKLFNLVLFIAGDLHF